MRLGSSLFAMMLLVVAAPLAAAQQVTDPVAAIAGRWEIVNGQTGEVTAPCGQGQTFTPTGDRRYVDLTFDDAPSEPPTRYIVLQAQPNRVLMFIEGESRVTAAGDPVVWWAVFDGPDRFAWRRTDWGAQMRTAAVWRRCRDVGA
jgi:hypothetical protein